MGRKSRCKEKVQNKCNANIQKGRKISFLNKQTKSKPKKKELK